AAVARHLFRAAEDEGVFHFLPALERQVARLAGDAEGAEVVVRMGDAFADRRVAAGAAVADQVARQPPARLLLRRARSEPLLRSAVEAGRVEGPIDVETDVEPEALEAGAARDALPDLRDHLLLHIGRGVAHVQVVAPGRR